MDTEIKEIDLSGMKADVLAALKAEMKAEAEAKASKEAELKAFAAEVKDQTKQEMEAEFKAREAALRKAPAYNRRVGKYSKSEGTDEFLNWMKTGDNGALKVLKPSNDAGYQGIAVDLPTKYEMKALQEGADTEGGYLVPEDFQASIVALREQMSWVRQAGVSVMQTNLQHVKIPVEATALAKLTATAEEAAYTTNDPLFNEVDIQVYKFTKLTKIAEELLQDDATNMELWYARRLAEVAASTESYYVAIGSGSAQPQGVFVGGTAALTFDSTDNITADEVPELFYKLKKSYRANSAWLMAGEVEGYLRKLRDANNWAFEPMFQPAAGMQWFETLYGRPVHNDEGCATMATAAKVIIVGDFSYYTLAESKAISISRNPYLYQANGQVGFFSNFRFGGAVTQAEAFAIGTMA